VTGLFPPQDRDLQLPTEGSLSPHAALRVCTEVATVCFQTAARKINQDWDTHFDPRQIQRWSERVGDRLVDERGHALELMQKNHVLPPSKLNEHELLVIGVDGGRVQNRAKNQDDSHWCENKVLTVTSYLKGDGTDAYPPEKLISSYLATMQHAEGFGRLARLEAERRGIRRARQTILMGDGAAWIDTIADNHFPYAVRIVDWYHASEHLCDVAKAVYPNDGSRQTELWAGLKSLLWEGKFDVLMDKLRSLSETAGRPPAVCMETDPRKVLLRNHGYFERHRQRMDYPRYRRNGWPTGSGVVESGVKLFNKRVKGTEQFWSTRGVESVMALRAGWLSEETEFYHQLYARPNKWAA
jgi:hypothetical protein